MNASWITHCFPHDAAGSCREADGCCHATEHPSAPVILQETLITWCCSFLLMVWAVGPACGPGVLSLLGRSWEPGQQRVSPCSCSREVLLVSEHTEFGSSLGRSFPVCPTGCLPFPPLLSPQICAVWQSFEGKYMGLGAALGRKQREKCGTALPPRNGNNPCHQWE